MIAPSGSGAPPSAPETPSFTDWLQRQYDAGSLDQAGMNLATKLGVVGTSAQTITPTSTAADRFQAVLGNQPPPTQPPGAAQFPQAGPAGVGVGGMQTGGFTPPKDNSLDSIDKFVSDLPDQPPPETLNTELPGGQPASQSLPRPFGAAMADTMLLNPLDPKSAGVAGGSAGGTLDLGELKTRYLSTLRDAAMQGDPSAIARIGISPLTAGLGAMRAGAEYGTGTRGAGDTMLAGLLARGLAHHIPIVSRFVGPAYSGSSYILPRLLGR